MAESFESSLKALISAVRENDTCALRHGLQSKLWNTRQKTKGMLLAARLGNEVCFNIFMEFGAKIEKINSDMRTCLHMVIRHGNGNLEIIKKIIENIQSHRMPSRKYAKRTKNVNFLDKRDIMSCSALYYASERGLEKVVHELIVSGANVNITNLTDAVTPLMIACESGHLGTVKELILGGADVNKTDIHKQHSLFYAVRSGKSECLEALLENSCKINQLSNLHQTALMVAALAGSASCISVLLNAHCSAGTIDVYGRSALSCAIHSQNVDAVKILLAEFKDKHLENIDMSVHVAAKRNRPEVIRLMFDLGWNLNRKSFDGRSLLHSAAGEAATECVQFLLEPNISDFPIFDINARSDNGMTPIHYACRRHCPEIVGLLLKHNAQTQVLDINGITPLGRSLANVYSAYYLPKKYSIAKQMLRYEFYRDIISSELLEAAVKNENICLVEMMLAAGFTINSAILTAGGINFPEGHKRRNLLQLLLVNQMASLRQLCRRTIRKELGTNIIGKVQGLGLPQLLQNFIKLPELDEIEEKHGQAEEYWESISLEGSSFPYLDEEWSMSSETSGMSDEESSE